jgi:hypothetical protein
MLHLRSVRVGSTAAPLLALLASTALAACSAGVDDTPDGVDPTPEDGVNPPFVVSTYYAPSGFMGDGSDGVSLVADTAGCAPRPSGAEGDCYRFTYTPNSKLWAGVYWQFPANNWGAAEGKQIAPGATQVSFYAASAGGGETLKVTVGGIHDVTLQYSDTLKAAGEFPLTTTMTKYTVPLNGQTYDRVIGGFSWVVALPQGSDATTAKPVVVYLDNIMWE